ncbi:MAG TPA: hypothetical protein VFA75_10085 [Nevskia sp.]|nr:hypothetical protein [Nevskia sp.]
MSDGSRKPVDQRLAELLQGEAWASTSTLYSRSSFENKERFNEWLLGLKNTGCAVVRTGQFGLEVGLPGTPAPLMERPDAKATPRKPAGAGPMPPLLQAPAPLLEGPARIQARPQAGRRERGIVAPAEERAQFVLPSPETAHVLRVAPTEAAPEEPAEAIVAAPAVEVPPAAPAPIAAPVPPETTQPAPMAHMEEASMPKSKPTADAKKDADAQRDIILGLLRQSSWKTADLIKATGLPRAKLYPLLKQMRKEKLVRLQGTARAATWSLPGAGKPGAIAAVDQVRKAAEKKAPGPITITAALQELEQRMRPRVIERLEVKLEVLDRLGRLFDPMIASVLSEIRADLAQ